MAPYCFQRWNGGLIAFIHVFCIGLFLWQSHMTILSREIIPQALERAGGTGQHFRTMGLAARVSRGVIFTLRSKK